MANKNTNNEIRVSFRQTLAFRSAAAEYLRTFPADTKLKFALEKMFKRTEDGQAKWIDKSADIDLDHALVDERGAVIFEIENNARKYGFSKEDLRKRDKAIEKALDEKGTVILEPFYCDLPKDLHESWIPVFTPFVIKPALVN